MNLDMNLDLYRAFYYTAEYGNITKASEQLYITQPAVSRAIRQLETKLKCTLFIRTSKGVVLTPEGTVLHQYIGQAFNFISNGEKKIDEMKNLQYGEIRIGASDTICKHYLIPYLKLFNSLHPAVKIHVICPTMPAAIMLLKSGKIDFAIINMPYNDEQLNFKNIMEIRDCFVTGRKYMHLCNTMLPLSQIITNPLLLPEQSSNSRLFIDQYFKSNNVSVVPDFELGNMDLLLQFVKYDFGIACVIKDFIEDELENGSLFEVKPIERIPSRYIGIAWLKNIPLSPATKHLIDNMDYFDMSDI